jgi:hypothetical protein
MLPSSTPSRPPQRRSSPDSSRSCSRSRSTSAGSSSSARASPPLGWAYAFLYRRIALELERDHPGEGGILVADQQTEHEKAFRDHELTRIRDELARHGRLTADYRLLLDRPLWIDSSLSTWDREIIQLADLVAFTTHEGAERGFASPGTRALWPTIRTVLARDEHGSLDGEGLVIFPKPEVWPTTA